MTRFLIRLHISACIALLAAPSVSAGAVPDGAKSLLETSGVKGGLIVVIGCDDPALLADVQAAGPYLVHGLDDDPGKVAAARKHLRQKDLYGPVSVSRLRGARLPFVDGVVNLVVVMGPTEVPADEMMRALAAGGVIADLHESEVAISRKEWPGELDEWTHYLHDASNNAVSNDRRVGPLQGLRWTCGPRFARSHEHFASMSTMVTAFGRVFSIIDEGPIRSVYLPPQWNLVARDAFSGVLLWKRSIVNWESHLRGFRSGPPEIARRLVAKGDRVYASLGLGQPVTVLDAATGRALRTFVGTANARELLLAGGVLYVLADDITLAQHEERKQWIKRVWPTLDIWYRFPRKAVSLYGTQRVVAIRVGSGERLWEREFKAPGEVMPATMAVDDGRLCLQTVSHLVCLDAAHGEERWRAERPVATSRFSWSTPTLVIHDGVVLSLDRAASANVGTSPPASGSEWVISSGGRDDRQDARLLAFSLADGSELWRAPASENYNVPGDVFVIDGTVWVGDLRGGGDPGFTQGRDLRTGKVTATIPPQKAWGHHRCYRNKATVKWLLVGRGGIQFIDPGTGAVQGHSWVRGGCQYGVMPANGLIYVPPHSCACQPEEMLIGFNALSSQSSAGDAPAPLDKGPAYEAASNLTSGSPKTSWPTYRRDVRRSGYQDLPAPHEPAVAWTRKLPSPITPPVAADGLVFVAETDRHTLHALSAADGKRVWTFVADGRIDSPPTLSGGRCVFGTRSGFVYCLRASDGTLVWRFRAAPRDRRLVAYEQLESAWPVHGSVLVDDRLSGGVSTAYVAAGRSSHLDGGIYLYALALTTGTLRHKVRICHGKGPSEGRIRQTALPGILSVQDGAVWMRGLGVDARLAPVADRPHLFAPRGFLDDTWWHRTYWVYGTAIGGGYTNWPTVGNVSPAGRLLAYDGGKFIYGYGRMAYRAGDGHVRPDIAKDYHLFAEVLDTRPAAESRRDGKRRIAWTAQPPFVVRAMVLTRDALLLAGETSATESAKGQGPGTFQVASREDGLPLTGCALSAAPVLDGMAFTDGGVFVSTLDGTVVCLRPAPKAKESRR